MSSQLKVGFIGGGQMATALLSGAIRSQVLSPSSVVVVERCQERCQELEKQFAQLQARTDFDAASDCDVVILALKPHVLREVGKRLAAALSGQRLWVSVAAGVSLAELSNLLGSQRIVRVMPNTPAQVGVGASAMCSLAATSEEDSAWVQRLMESVGICVRVDESLMHAVTAVAGSSPAFVYAIIEAMADGGVWGGLPRNIALQLAAQSVMGAAKMVLETGLHPGQLKDQVTSPAGTTIAGLRALESGGLRSAMIEAVQAATQRSRELMVQPTTDR